MNELKEIERKEEYLFNRLNELKSLGKKAQEEEMKRLQNAISGNELWDITVSTYLQEKVNTDNFDKAELERRLDIAKKDILRRYLESIISVSSTYKEAILRLINALNDL